MKLFLIILTLLVFSTSCENKKPIYPRYTLCYISGISDSLKKEHRKFIIELVRVSSQNITDGDCEDVNQMLREASNIAKEVYALKQLGLRKEVDNDYRDDVYILLRDMTTYEKEVFDSLRYHDARN